MKLIGMVGTFDEIDKMQDHFDQRVQLLSGQSHTQPGYNFKK